MIRDKYYDEGYKQDEKEQNNESTKIDLSNVSRDQ